MFSRTSTASCFIILLQSTLGLYSGKQQLSLLCIYLTHTSLISKGFFSQRFLIINYWNIATQSFDT